MMAKSKKNMPRASRNMPIRTKSFEAKLFERFTDESLMESAENIMNGTVRNTPQLNFIQMMITKKLDKEKQDGHTQIDYMSLMDVGIIAAEDDIFMDTLIKAFRAKQRLLKGQELQSPANYKQMKETVKKVVESKGVTTKEVRSKTRHLLDGSFDSELEEGHNDEGTDSGTGGRSDDLSEPRGIHDAHEYKEAEDSADADGG